MGHGIINIDGKKYIEKSAYNQELEEKLKLKRFFVEEVNRRVEELKNESQILPPSLDAKSVSLLDECNVSGIGSIKLEGDWKSVLISIEYLERAIKILKLMSTKKQGRESLRIVWTTDYPLMLGDIKGNTFSGVIIAPRSKTD